MLAGGRVVHGVRRDERHPRPLGEAAGLRPLDRILSVNGRGYETYREFLGILDFTPGGRNVYRIEREGETLEVAVPVRPLGVEIVLRHELRPFDEEETREYIAERLRLAGHTGGEVFKRSGVRTIWEVSGGVPRLVNVVCDSALLLGYARGWTTLGRGAILEVARDLDLPTVAPRRPGDAGGAHPSTRWAPFGLLRKRWAGRA